MLTSWKLDPHTVVRLKSGRTGDDVLKGGHLACSSHKPLTSSFSPVTKNNAIYFIQHLENTGKKRIKFLIDKSWRTIKVIGKTGPRAMSCYDLLIWTDSSPFLLCYVTEENCHASRQNNVPPFMDGVLVKYPVPGSHIVGITRK